MTSGYGTISAGSKSSAKVACRLAKASMTAFKPARMELFGPCSQEKPLHPPMMMTLQASAATAIQSMPDSIVGLCCWIALRV